MVHATGNLEKVMDESRRVATTAILHCADRLDPDPAGIERRFTSTSWADRPASMARPQGGRSRSPSRRC